jgi:hypothetical protein
MTVAIGSPAGSHSWYPNGAVSTGSSPGSIIVEVVGTYHVGRHIFVGSRVIFALVAHATPIVKAIETRGALNLVLQQCAARESRLMPRLDQYSRPLPVGFALAAPYCDRGGIGIWIDVEAVVTRFQNREGLVRGIDFVGLATEKMTDVQVQRALVQFDLHDIVTDIGEGQAGLGVHAQRGAAQMQLRSSFLIRPYTIRCGQGAVHDGFRPIIHATGLDGDRAGNVLDAHCASRRIGIGVTGNRRQSYKQRQ